ncbi:hypothetical protein, partial [Candidatus Darwinibacter acetoxidans]
MQEFEKYTRQNERLEYLVSADDGQFASRDVAIHFNQVEIDSRRNVNAVSVFEVPHPFAVALKGVEGSDVAGVNKVSAGAED